MNKIFELIANISIKYNLKYSYKIFYILFKFFLKKKIILNFDNYKFYAYPEKKDLSRWMIRNLKIWDKKNIYLIKNKIYKKEAIFLDIGCNYGAYSIPIAKYNEKINVYCFDPSKKSVDKLIENIKLNQIKNIKFFQIGIGEKLKKVNFDDNLSNYKNSGSYQVIDSNAGTKIDINSIDNLILDGIITPKENIFIKIDIEGYEFFALQGLTKTIKDYNVMIFFEFSKNILKNHENFKFKFNEFIKTNNLIIQNNQFEEQDLDQMFLKLNNLGPNHEVLDNFILMKKKHNFYSLQHNQI